MRFLVAILFLSGCGPSPSARSYCHSHGMLAQSVATDGDGFDLQTVCVAPEKGQLVVPDNVHRAR